MGVVKRSKAEITRLREQSRQREQRCWELQLRCWTQTQIAQELDIHQQQVSRYLRKSNQRLSLNLSEQVGTYKVDQLDKLGYILAEALSAWRDKPNPKFLGEARGALKDIRDLMGLDQPVAESNSISVADIIREFSTNQEPVEVERLPQDS